MDPTQGTKKQEKVTIPASFAALLLHRTSSQLLSKTGKYPHSTNDDGKINLPTSCVW